MISKIELIINGEKVFIPIEITDEQIQQLTKAVEVENPPIGWEKPEIKQNCFFESKLGEVGKFEVNAANAARVDELYDNVNCYCSELIAENIVRADKLYRELRRFAITNRKSPLDMINLGGYTINYNYTENCLECGLTGSWRGFGEVLFDTEALAQEAITLFRDELLWYFTQMRERF